MNLIKLKSQMSDPKIYIILNAVIVILLVAYFLTVKKKQHPTKLNFKAEKPLEDFSALIRDVPLNVFFNYNGHSFDAYEVLGAPAGSTPEEIQNAYQKTLATATDPTSREFYKVALEAIQNASKKR